MVIKVKRGIKSDKVVPWKESISKSQQDLALESKKSHDKAMAEQRKYMQQCEKLMTKKRVYGMMAIYAGIAVLVAAIYMLHI